MEPLTKLLPFTVKVKAALPAARVFGLRLEIVGTGLFTVKLLPAEVPPSVFTTVTGKVPAEASCAEGMVTEMEVPLTEDGVSVVAPFHFTTAPVKKLLPVMVTAVFPLPAVADDGLMFVMAGVLVAAALTVKVLPAEVPPPGVALVTVTDGVEAEATSVAGISAVICVADT